MSYYSKTGVPATGANVESKPIRNEFALIEAGFDTFPILEADKVLRVNSTESAIELTSYVDTSGMPGIGKNKIINGNFDFWQRGTSQYNITGYNSADRWILESTGANIEAHKFDITSEGEIYHGLAFSDNSSTPAKVSETQRIESVRTLAGKQGMLSFYARAGSVSITLKVSLIQNFGSGGSATINDIGLTTIELSTIVTKHEIAISIPSIAGKTVGADSYLGVKFEVQIGAGGNRSCLLSRVQLEEGTIATPFEQRLLAEEARLCYRYYWRGLPALSLYTNFHTSSAKVSWRVKFPVTMRALPTVAMSLAGSTKVAMGSETFDSQTLDGCELRFVSTGAAPSAFISFLTTNYFSADAEL